jgi:hypothetical protein
MFRVGRLIVAAVLVQAMLVPTAVAGGLGVGTSADDAAFDGARKLVYPPAVKNPDPPRFVHQTLNNCMFASVAMLLDKWTKGALRVDQADLRAASGVPGTKGVSFGQLARSVAAVTRVQLRYSPYGGEKLTWRQLLARLARGSGAVLGGAYSDFPAHYQRWAPDYAALGRQLTGHAVYIERYEQTEEGGRVWLMDPIAWNAKFKGEWISVRDLLQFAWISPRGLVAAAVSPPSRKLRPGERYDPFVLPKRVPDYRVGVPVYSSNSAFAEQALAVSLPFSMRRGTKEPRELALAVTWQVVELDPQPEATDEESQPKEITADGQGWTPWAIDDDVWLERDLRRTPPAEGEGEAATDEETGQQPVDEDLAELELDDETIQTFVPLAISKRSLTAELTAPAEPGTYTLTVEVRSANGNSITRGRAKSQAEPFGVRVLGPQAVAYSELVVPGLPLQGTTVKPTVTITNLGSANWSGESGARLLASWRTADWSASAGSAPVELSSGESGRFSFELRVPTESSEAELVLELQAADGTNLSAYGSDPLVQPMAFEVPPYVSTDLGHGEVAH